ncbi:MAG: AraC family transcriptional regulator, partial [Gelidibacter sp.]
MKIFIKFDFTTLSSRFIDDKLREIGIKYRMLNFGEIEFLEKVPEDKLQAFDNILDDYGIEKIENQKVILVQKMKDTIIDMVLNANDTINVKSSVYLSDKLGHSYGYLSNVFSEVTY